MESHQPEVVRDLEVVVHLPSLIDAQEFGAREERNCCFTRFRPMRQQEVDRDQEVSRWRAGRAEYVGEHLIEQFTNLDPAVRPSFECHQS